MSSEPAVPDRSHHPAINPSRDAASPLVMRGEAAKALDGEMTRAVGKGFGWLRQRRGTLYELVTPPDLASGLDAGILRSATASRGDASVLVKEIRTGRVAGHKDLVKAKPAVLGPAVWQAMALATQQHYLAEINEKLARLQVGIDEVLARHEDDRRGDLAHHAENARALQSALAAGESVSRARLDDFRRNADAAKGLWHRVAETADRTLALYRDGKATAEDVEGQFIMLLSATQVLVACSRTLLAIPKTTAAEVDEAEREERDRLYPALPRVRQYARDLLDASSEWNRQEVAYVFGGAQSRLVRGMQLAVRKGPRKPRQRSLESLPSHTAWRCGMVASETLSAPQSILVEKAQDGSVSVTTERPAPPG